MSRIDISARSEALRRDMTMANLFAITVSEGDMIAAHWLGGDEEKSLTFAQMREKAMDYGALLRRAIGEVADERVIEPVEQVLADHARTREGIRRALG